MNATLVLRGAPALGAAALLVAAASGALGGCSKSEAATAPRKSDPAATAAPSPGKAHVDADNYVVDARPAGAAKAGEASAIDVVLTTKGDYHINKQYPYKFKLADPAPAGVTFPKPVLVRADGSFDEKTAKFHVPFVASKSGKVTVGGTFSLSVCSDANCIMDKQNVDVDVDVK